MIAVNLLQNVILIITHQIVTIGEIVLIIINHNKNTSQTIIRYTKVVYITIPLYNK